jgi:hypothetical protein
MRQRGAVTTAEADALYAEACHQLFRSLLDGDFVEHKLRLRVKPHFVSDAGVSQMLPEHAELFRGVHWAGAHGRDGDALNGWITRHWNEWYEEPIAALEHRDAIRDQAIGAAYTSPDLDVPARYEVHLDRKLERTLAMLFRLRELRRPAAAA